MVPNGCSSPPFELVVFVSSLVAGMSGPNFQAGYAGSIPVSRSTVKPASSLSVNASPASSVFGQIVTLAATVTAVSPSVGLPTGTVTFRDGTTVLCTTVAVSLGTATICGRLDHGEYRDHPDGQRPAGFADGCPCRAGRDQRRRNGPDDGDVLRRLPCQTTTLAVGIHLIGASYLGDAGFGTSNSATVNEVVVKTSTTTTLTSSANPAVKNQMITFTAAISSAPSTALATGTVTFKAGTINLCLNVVVTAGTASCAVSTLAIGTSMITAVYTATGNFTGSTYAVFVQQVTTIATATTLTSSANPTVTGQATTLKATVAPVAPGTGTPTGSVTFFDNGIAVSTINLAGGSAAIAELGDRSHVDRRVQRPVPASRQAVRDPRSRRVLDRGCAVVRGEVITVPEPAYVTTVTNQGRGDDRPTPNNSVSEVPDARTVLAIRRCDSFSCASSRRMLSTSSTASSKRTRSTDVTGDRPARNASAALAWISLLIPPGASSTSNECNRDTSRLRWRPPTMSVLRFARSRNSSLSPTAETGRKLSCRSAVTATDIASFGSFLFERVDASTRVRAASVAGTSTTDSPAATSCWASKSPSPSAPSIAHVRWLCCVVGLDRGTDPEAESLSHLIAVRSTSNADAIRCWGSASVPSS
jgi:hypothetical protein